MKRIKLFVLTSFVLSLLLISNCTKEEESENNAVSSEDQIKEEIIAVGDTIMARFERLDAEGIFQLYSPDFIAFGLYGNEFKIDSNREFKEFVTAASDSNTVNITID